MMSSVGPVGAIPGAFVASHLEMLSRGPVAMFRASDEASFITDVNLPVAGADRGCEPTAGGSGRPPRGATLAT